jgi:hypothetical protein
MSGSTLPGVAEVAGRARAVLEHNWVPAGYTTPHTGTYPFAWLWDSCFHAVAWVALGEPARAVAELTHVFRTQDPLGFVPHVDYEAAPDVLADFWGRSGASGITQPPMYGHTIAELHRRGVDVPPDLLDRAGRGLRFLLDRRVRDHASGLVTVVHPWESGADDSPRWDHWCGAPDDRFDPASWYRVKGELVGSIVVEEPHGSPVANPAFGAAPVGFNALVSFNALELASVTADAALERDALDLAAVLDDRWDPDRRTWVDAGPGEPTSGGVRTLDALLPLLVCPGHGPQVWDELFNPDAFGGSCGPAGVDRREPSFAPTTYWRGPAWPQLTYLHWVAAVRAGGGAPAAALAERLVRGALASGFAEYWHPDDGRALGAVPQGWAALAAVVGGSGGDAGR